MWSNRPLRRVLLILPISFLLAACDRLSASEPTATPMTPSVASTATTAPATPTSEIRTFTIVPAASEAQYSVEEEIFGQTVGFIDTVGHTNAIEGQFQLEITGSQVRLLDNKFVVDLRTLKSNDSRRDSRIRREWLESDRYPWAEFRATGIEEWPANAAEGQEIIFKVVGELTVREISRPVTFDMKAKLEGDTLTGIGTAFVMMVDYGFQPPSILGMLRVKDGVTITIRFTAKS